MDNYLLVDEMPPDGDTTYVETDTASTQDQYHVEDYDGTGREIVRVWTEARARSTEPTGETIKLGIKTGGYVFLGSGVSLINQYVRVVGDDYYENPDTSTGWTDSDLDGIQVVIEAA